MSSLQAVAMFNASGQFLQYISKERAVALVYADMANSVKDSKEVWNSPSTRVVIPKGIMLKGRAHKFIQNENTFNREKMFKRDNHTCQYCGKRGGKMTLEHIQPQSKGGGDSWENCVAACEDCNNKKGNKTLKESGMTLLKKPTKPKIVDDAEVWRRILEDDDDEDMIEGDLDLQLDAS